MVGSIIKDLTVIYEKKIREMNIYKMRQTFCCYCCTLVLTMAASREKRNHFESKKVICFACCKKDTKMISLIDNPALIKLVLEFVDCGFNQDLNEHPTGVCRTCKTYLIASKVYG